MCVHLLVSYAFSPENTVIPQWIFQYELHLVSCFHSPSFLHAVAWCNVLSNSEYWGTYIKICSCTIHNLCHYSAKFMNIRQWKTYFTHLFRSSIDLTGSLPLLRFIDLYKLALGPSSCNMFHAMKFYPSLKKSRNFIYEYSHSNLNVGWT